MNGKFFKISILAICLLAFSGNGDLAAEKQEVITEISDARIEKILKGIGLSYKKVPDPKDGVTTFVFFLQGITVVLANHKTNLQILSYFSRPGASLKAINEWNENTRFTSAYIDEDGDVALQSDMDLEGGVTEKAVQVYILTFRDVLLLFMRHLNQSTQPQKPNNQPRKKVEGTAPPKTTWERKAERAGYV